MTTLQKIKAEIEDARYGLINDGLDVALKIIDKYAEQEPPLEKIRAEITELFKASNVGNTSLCFAVLQTIDKYASEYRVKNECRVKNELNVELNELKPSEECDNDCEHCAYIECPKGGE